MKVGIIGCGNIGTELALFIDKSKNFDLKYLCDINNNNIKKLQRKLKNKIPRATNINRLIENSDLVIESASKDAVGEILKSRNINRRNRKLLIMSTGGIIENINLLNKIKNCEIYIPSGAIAGLDAIKAVSGKIKSLTITTTKPVKGFKNSTYLIKNNINLDKIKNKEIIFEGNLKDAIKWFPQNINVAATLFLACRFKNIKIKIVADPKSKTNNHEIICKGSFGTITTKTENLLSKNPRTSYLAILSAVQTLKGMKDNIKIGV